MTGCALHRLLKRRWQNSSSPIRTTRTRQKLPSFYLTAYDHNQGHREERLRVDIGQHTGEFGHIMEDFFGRNVISASHLADHVRGMILAIPR